MPPVPGTAFPVGDGDDEDEINFNGVERRVRKDPCSTEVHILLENTPTSGCGSEFGDSAPDFPGEASAKSATALLVEPDSLLEFPKRLGMELMPHFASRRSMRR